METDPLKLLVVVGLKVTLIMHEAFRVSDAGQLFVAPKGGLGAVMLAITSGAVPLLIGLTVLVELVVCTAW